MTGPSLESKQIFINYYYFYLIFFFVLKFQFERKIKCGIKSTNLKSTTNLEKKAKIETYKALFLKEFQTPNIAKLVRLEEI